jgi:hypothetical protein
MGGMEELVLRVSMAVQHKVLQHLVALDRVHAPRDTLEQTAVRALQIMCGMESMHVFHVLTAAQHKVLQHLVALDHVRAQWRRRILGQRVHHALQTMCGMEARVQGVSMAVQHKVLQHLVILDRVRVYRTILVQHVICAVEPMWEMKAARVWHVKPLDKLYVILQFAARE